MFKIGINMFCNWSENICEIHEDPVPQCQILLLAIEVLMTDRTKTPIWLLSFSGNAQIREDDFSQRWLSIGRGWKRGDKRPQHIVFFQVGYLSSG